MNTKSALLAKVRGFAKCTKGANLVEYIILVGVIAVLCIFAFGQFGEAVKAKVSNQKTAVEGINDTAK